MRETRQATGGVGVGGGGQGTHPKRLQPEEASEAQHDGDADQVVESPVTRPCPKQHRAGSTRRAVASALARIALRWSAPRTQVQRPSSSAARAWSGVCGPARSTETWLTRMRHRGARRAAHSETEGTCRARQRRSGGEERKGQSGAHVHCVDHILLILELSAHVHREAGRVHGGKQPCGPHEGSGQHPTQ